MSRLLIQQYLDGGGTFEDLLTKHAIKHRRHRDYQNLVLFKYGVDPDFTDPLVRECRGIVLDESDSWRVVSRAFDKFANHGEPYLQEIDWSTARVQEKLDGSLAVLYSYAGAWHVATSGSPDASGIVQSAGTHSTLAFGDRTFAAYFWETLAAAGGYGPSPHGVYDDLCLAFELMGPMNRVVVVHDKPWMRLLGVRNRVTGQQYLPEVYADVVGIPPVRSFPLTSIEEIAASFERISPVSQEGYVVVDAEFRRLKVKHPGYVALHHAKDGMGPRAFVDIARTGEVSEVISAFPEFQPLIDDARRRYENLIADVHADYQRFKDLPTQKEFAMQVKDLPHSAALFQMRKGVDPAEFFRSVPVERLMAWMGVASDEVSS